MDYTNRKGKLKQEFSVGNSFDRFKWSGPLYRTLTEIPAINSLWSVLMELYTIYAAPFMLDRGSPEAVCASLPSQLLPGLVGCPA